jgi:protocatechuate 3,4-dioxygenase beta subunit
MTRRVRLALLVCLAAAHDAPAQTATRADALRGRVVDATNSAPLRRVRLTVSSGDRPVDTAFTDNDGRFVIPSVPTTPLTVRAAKGGYVAAVASLPAGRGGTDVAFSLPKSAAVTGRIVDSNGSPVSGAFVVARRLLADGRKAPDSAGRFFAASDALGDYRLGGLPAGRYEITAAHVPPEYREPGVRIEDRLFGPPENLDLASDAAAITLAGGDEAHDIDFTIPDVGERCLAESLVPSYAGDVAGSIGGRVTAATGEPLVCATVRVIAPDVDVPPAFTDRQGRYALNGLPAGSFIIEARQGGHLVLLHGQRTPSDVELPVTLRQGEQRLRADIVLPRESIITGTVVDEHGEPIEGVQVWAFQLRALDGGPPTLVSSGVPRMTDDRGHYRLTGMRPGTYFVRTQPLRAALGWGESVRAYGAVYYPGTTDVATARRVSLDGGRDAHGVDIAVAPVAVGSVTGTVIDAAGRPFVGAVSVFPSARAGALSAESWTAATDATGAFTVRHVPRGEHVVKAAADGARHFGMQYVTVGTADPPPVRVTLTPGATLEGRVIVEGAPDLNMAGFTISVAPATSDFAPPSAGMLTMFARQDDGTFRVTGARGPSRIVIGGMPACDGCYLKSAYINGTDAVDRPFDFGLNGGVYRDVELTVSDGAAMLEGQAVDERDARAYTVAVFPVDRTLWFSRSRYIKTGRSQADGSFRVTGLPPGDYLVAAVNRLEFGLGELADVEMLEQLAAGGQRVTLAERDRKTLSLRLIRR